MDAAEKQKGNKKMKVELMAMAALAACSAVAMPTNDEIEKANADVMTAFQKQLAAWQGGSISDSDLSALMLMNAGKYKDEARHYVCLQAAFAGAARAAGPRSSLMRTTVWRNCSFLSGVSTVSVR